MSAPRFSAVVFDLDGTLIHSAPSILETFRRVLARHGLAPAAPLTSALIGPPLNETLRSIAGADFSGSLDELAADFRRIYDDEACLEAIPYPGIDHLLKSLTLCSTRLFIATNKRETPTRRIIDHCQWAPHFEQVCALDRWRQDFNPKASKGDMLVQLIENAGLGREQTAMVGDTPEDAAAASQAGIAFFGAAWGYGQLDTLPDCSRFATAESMHAAFLRQG